MAENRLKLNSHKTEFLIIGTRQQLAKMQYSSISICGENIPVGRCVWNLGVLLDSEMKMTDHVQHVVRVC